MRMLVTLSVCLLSAAAGYVTTGGPLLDSCRDCRASAEQRQRQQLRWLRGKVSLTQAGQADEEKPPGTAVEFLGFLLYSVLYGKELGCGCRN